MDPIVQNPIPSPLEQAPKKSIGTIIGILVVAILLIVGALYLWGSKLSSKDTAGDAAQSQRMMASQAQAVAPVSDSDDISSIDQDLKADSGTEIDFSSIDKI